MIWYERVVEESESLSLDDRVDRIRMAERIENAIPRDAVTRAIENSTHTAVLARLADLHDAAIAIADDPDSPRAGDARMEMASALADIARNIAQAAILALDTAPR